MDIRMSNIASPVPQIRAKFTNKLGIPLSGCKVYTYEPNSNIPKTTWLDIDKTAENTNPILLDAAGEADIFLDGLYRIVIKDQFNFVVYDVEKTGISLSMLVRPNGQSVETSLTNIDAELNNKQQQIDEKPSQQYVDEKLDLKAPKETTYTKLEVDSALSQKAPQATTYTKAEVDTAFAAYVGGRKAFTTLALAQAAQSSLPANTAIEVTNDGANNGTYQWNGTTLTKSAYDPLTQAKSYTDQSLKVIGVGVNLFNKKTVTNNKFWDYRNGILTDTALAVSASALIAIESNTEYQLPSHYSQQIAFFDENKAYVSGLVNVTTSGHKFTTPTNARYLGLAPETARLNEMMLCKASEFPTTYVPFSRRIENLRVDVSEVDNLFKDVRNDLGVHNVNIFNKSTALSDSYIDHATGNLFYTGWFCASAFIEVVGSKEYQFSSDYSQQGAFYDINKVYISGFVEPSADKKITTPANAKYICFTVPVSLIDTLVFAESSHFPTAFVPFGSVQIDNLIVPEKSAKPTVIWVTFDENSTNPKFAFKGKNAIQRALDSITDNTATNRYAIRVDAGIDKITQANEFIGYRGYPSMVVPKDHVDIIGSGEGKTIVWAELPYSDADIGASIDGNVYPRAQYQTLYDYADDCVIKDITFVGKNIRYTNHIDDVRGTDKTHKYKNVGMIFKGDIGSLRAYGTGTHSGEETYIIGGRSHSDTHLPYSCHNNISFEKPSLWSFKGHNFTSLSGKIAIYQQNCGSLVEDKLELIGCSFGGASYQIYYVEVWLSANTANNYDSFNHAEWQLSGYGNDPFLFNNEVGGESLRFKTTATGIGNTIRFDKTSSAYPILIKNNQSNSTSSLYLNNRVFIDEYIVQDGSIGLSAQAFGCKDLSSKNGAYDGGVNYTSLAKRLGDCSTTNKSLVVIVNGTSNTITFNKNYSSMSNAQIVAEMNTQISGATIDLISYGRDYYPMITDVCEVAYNTGATYIPKGSVVTKVSGSVKLANGNDKIFGVALDDIPVQQVLFDGEKHGQGRVLKRGYIYADLTKPHYVLTDIHRPTLGSKFKVVNGQLVSDENGKISVDIDAGVVSINC